MPQTLTERVTELEQSVAVLTVRLDTQARDLERFDQQLSRLIDGLAAARTDIAVLQQGLAEVVKRLDERDRNRWSIIGLFVGCLLTFIANLLLVYLKK